MESGLADLKYPLPSYLRRGRQDTHAYNQESDCPLHYRKHHSWGEQKQKHHRRIPRHICRRSSHTDILRPPHQRPRHNHYHHQRNQQHQQNNSNSIHTTTTSTLTTDNNNNNNTCEAISSHSVKCLQQTRQQSVTTNRRSEAQSSTLQRTLIRVEGSGLEHWIPVQCRADIHPEYRGEFIHQEFPLHFTNPRLTISRLRRHHSDPGVYQPQHETRSCNDYPVYLRLVPQRRPDEKPNLCTQKQSKLKDNNLTHGACPLVGQSQSICDCPRGGCDDPPGFYFPGQINLDKTQGKESEAIRINDEDKEILDKDFVMGGRETALFPWRIIRDQIVPRPGHTDRKYSIVENGGREIGRTVEFATSAHKLVDPKVSGVFQNHNESNACKTQLENNNSLTMSSITRNEANEEFETNSEHTALNINAKSRTVFQEDKSQRNDSETQSKEDPEKDINTNIRVYHKLKITTPSNLRKNINAATETRNNTIYKTESNLCANNLLLSLGRFVTGYNITRLRVFLFVFFVGCALQSASWPFPGVDAKAVLSQSKNVLMTDADPKQVSSIGKIDPPSEFTKEDRSFNDFPDVDSDSDRSVASDSSSNGPGEKGNAGDGSSPSTKTNSNDPENKENVDEYEAYDDSTGEETTDTTDLNGKKQNPRKENPDQNSDNHDRYSDQDDEEIADSVDEEDEDEDDDDDEDWAGDMSSQPIFVPPGMDVDGVQAGMGATGKHSTELETPAKSEDEPLKREIPEYMLKLYQKFTQKHYIHPASDTVRSFSNINDDLLFNTSNGNELPRAKTRNHTLIFNISSFPRGEQINLAQLRLYKLVERDRNTYIGDDRKVSLYEVITQDDGTRHLKLVSQKHIYGRNSGWESFDVTPAVRRWVAEIESGAVQMLEVIIESIFNSMWGNDVDISTEPRNKKEPLLVVFSKQINKRLVHQQERDELLQHDMTLSDIEDVDNFTTIEPPPSSRSSTYSNGDQSDDDEEDDDDEDSSREDAYGSIGEMTSYAKVTQSMRTGKESLSRSKQKVRVKRSKRSSKRNICRRTKLEVDFRDIQGHGWIVAPTKYQAFECSGKCYFPLGDHLRPTKHAIIRANLHLHNKKVTRPCCVPTKLDSITLLYLDSKTNGYTFKYKFEGMKVVECGCR